MKETNPDFRTSTTHFETPFSGTGGTYLNFADDEAGSAAGADTESDVGVDDGGGDESKNKITAPAAISRLTVIIITIILAERRNLYPHFSQ
jgi:hypothetical protein